MRHISKMKALWPIAGVALGLLIGTAFAQLVDNNNRVWTGTQTFNAPVTFGTSAPVTFSGGTNLGGGEITGPLLIDSGSVSAPAYAFSDDDDSGLFLNGAGRLAFATSGSTRLEVVSNGAAFSVVARLSDGTVASPGVQFTSDADTGLYSTAEDCLGMAQGGKDAGQLCVAQGTLSAAQVAALNATPITVIAAVASHAIVVRDAVFKLDFVSAAYDDDGAGEDLVLQYATSNSVILQCDNATCLDVDATADVWAYSTPGDAALLGIPVVVGEAVEITIAAGEIFDAAGDSPIDYLIRYYVVDDM